MSQNAAVSHRAISRFARSPLPVYLINLSRRPDRLLAMTRQLADFDIEFTRIEAVDGKTLCEDVVRARFERSGPLGQLSPGDMGCALSHLLTWHALANSPHTHAAVLEDDIVLNETARKLLADASWIPFDIQLLKLERFGPRNQITLLGPARTLPNGLQVARLLSKHCGTGGYIISREAARWLLENTRKMNLSVDHLLFNPNNSDHFAALQPWQLLPALLEQSTDVGGPTDIRGSRLASQPSGAVYWKREAIRAAYDLYRLPVQVAQALSGKARPTRITFER